MSAIVWHDVECGSYTADLPLWEELAAAAGGPVLDVGAGTGRVALHLARAGHAVTALDVDGDLLAELERRAHAVGLDVDTIVADAADFDAGPFALVAVPMQTIQLLPGRAARAAFLRSAREHLVAGGLVALAVSEALEPFEVDPAASLPPDRGERDGWRYLSFPVAIRPRGDVVVLERVRQAIAPDGSASVADDAIELASLTAGELEAEGAAAGLRPEPARTIDPTPEHVGSQVVLLRG
jgi:SAM-dependent methyltransferase